MGVALFISEELRLPDKKKEQITWEREWLEKACEHLKHSPFFASHLVTGALQLEAHAPMPDFPCVPGIWTQVFTPVQQMFYPLSRSPSSCYVCEVESAQ